MVGNMHCNACDSCDLHEKCGDKKKWRLPDTARPTSMTLARTTLHYVRGIFSSIF